MEFIKEPAKRIAVLDETDVLVVGGGPAGVAAAIAAARLGAKVILVERYSFLGGLATGGNVIEWPGFKDGDSEVYGGIGLEIIRQMIELNAAATLQLPSGNYYHCDPEILKYVYEQLALAAGVKIIQHMLAVGTIMNNNHIRAVVFEDKSGRHAIAARIYLDATGDGDLMFWSGAPFKKSSLPISFAWNFGGVNTDLINRNPERFFEHFQATVRKFGAVKADDPYPLPMTGTLWCNGTYFYKKDPLSPIDLTEVDCAGRKRALELLRLLKKAGEFGFKNAFIFNTSSVTGVRAARQLDGRHVLTIEEIKKGNKFHDSIGLAETVQHISAKVAIPKKRFQIPYRCLIPKKVSNLLVAGRCISVIPSTGSFKGPLEQVRPIPQCTVTGQAAGVAAALAAQTEVPPAKLNVKTVQEILLSQGGKIGANG